MRWAFVVWASCVSVDPTVGSTEPTGTEVPTIETAEVGLELMGHFGAITIGEVTSLGFGQNGIERYGFAQFVDDDGGLANYAECARTYAPSCVVDFPAVGKTVSAATLADLSAYNSATFFDVGRVEAGGLLFRRRVEKTGTVSYAAPPLSEFPSKPAGGIRISGGDYAAYEGVSDFLFADELRLLSPPLDAAIVMGQGDRVEVQWEPGGVGDVLLDVQSQVTHLPDTGKASFSIDDVPHAEPFDTFNLLVGRMTYQDVDANGNTIRMQTRRDRRTRVIYVNRTDATPLGSLAAPSCADATGLPAVAAGRYVGDDLGDSPDHDLYDFGAVQWRPYEPLPDLVVPVDLLAGQTIDVDLYKLFGMVYFVNASCSAVLGWDADDDHSTLSYLAPVDQRVFVVLDSWAQEPLAGTDAYLFDLAIGGL